MSLHCVLTRARTAPLPTCVHTRHRHRDRTASTHQTPIARRVVAHPRRAATSAAAAWLSVLPPAVAAAAGGPAAHTRAHDRHAEEAPGGGAKATARRTAAAAAAAPPAPKKARRTAAASAPALKHEYIKGVPRLRAAPGGKRAPRPETFGFAGGEVVLPAAPSGGPDSLVGQRVSMMWDIEGGSRAWGAGWVKRRVHTTAKVGVTCWPRSRAAVVPAKWLVTPFVSVFTAAKLPPTRLQ
jgi:hypothetical protein